MPTGYPGQVKRVREAAAILSDYKISKGCTDCGFALWPEALHFDHIDPRTKLASLGWVDDRSKLKTRAKLRAFIAHVEAYCAVRCANCHAHRTKVERHHISSRTALASDASTLF